MGNGGHLNYAPSTHFQPNYMVALYDFIVESTIPLQRGKNINKCIEWFKKQFIKKHIQYEDAGQYLYSTQMLPFIPVMLGRHDSDRWQQKVDLSRIAQLYANDVPFSGRRGVTINNTENKFDFIN